VETKTYLSLVLLLASCVPVTRFEEAESAAQVEAEGRRRAALELEASRQRVAELEAAVRARESELDARGRALDEQQLASNLSAKEREQSASLVDQLRGELARSSEHLKAYSNEKLRLERELEAAQRAEQTPAAPPAGTEAPPPAEPPEQVAPPASPPESAPAPPRVAALDLGELAKTVSMALAAVGLDRQVKVSTKPDAVELEIGEKNLFEPDSAALRGSMLALFAAASRLSSADPGLSGSIREANHDARLPSALGEERRAELAAKLKQHGLDGRIRLEPLDEPVSGSPKSYVLALRTSPPAPKK
jgi:hypothetical protein